VDLLIILAGTRCTTRRMTGFCGVEKVSTTVHLASHYNETSEYAQWHVPEAHFLESWGDARAFDGTYSVIQPLIAPLYRSHTAFGRVTINQVTAYETVRERMRVCRRDGRGPVLAQVAQ
jgi:hypothetical protein